MVFRAICFFSVLAFSTAVQAQDDCPCCQDAYRQFDFWLGNWEVKDTLGNLVGTNTIKKEELGCVVTEQWNGISGSTGQSMNYYNRIDGLWHQVWVDNAGNELLLKGKWDGKAMVLRGDVTVSKKGLSYYNQISWIPNDDKTVTQLWDIYNEEDKVINTLFKGIYYLKN